MSDEHASMSRDEMLDFYKIPREAVDVEAFAQQRARYLRYATEDAVFFNNFCNDPRLNGPLRFIRPGVSPEECLDPINAQLAALTPPKTLEDCIIRAQLAEAAFMVLDWLKGLSGHPDLEAQVESRTNEIHTAWMDNEFRRPFLPEAQSEFPGTASIWQALLVLKPPRDPVTSTSSRLQQADIENLLDTPNVMLEKRFYHLPGTHEGIVWEVEKYTISRGGGIVYKVRLKGCGDNLIRIDRDGLRLMLQESRVMPVV